MSPLSLEALLVELGDDLVKKSAVFFCRTTRKPLGYTPLNEDPSPSREPLPLVSDRDRKNLSAGAVGDIRDTTLERPDHFAIPLPCSGCSSVPFRVDDHPVSGIERIDGILNTRSLGRDRFVDPVDEGNDTRHPPH